jgi:hypothetical protein
VIYQPVLFSSTSHLVLAVVSYSLVIGRNIISSMHAPENDAPCHTRDLPSSCAQNILTQQHCYFCLLLLLSLVLLGVVVVSFIVLFLFLFDIVVLFHRFY